MLTASSIALAIGAVWLRTGRDPAALTIAALIHMRAAVRWVTREAWPAVARVRGRYRECVEAERRVA